MSNKKSSTAGSKKAANPRGFFIFFGLSITIIAAGILWFNGRVSSLDCQRLESSQINCTVQSRWLGVLTLEQQNIQQLEEASVNHNCAKDRNKPTRIETCVTSVDLATAGGVITLSPALASGGNQEHKVDVVEQINTFVNNPNTPSLHTVQTELGPQTIVLGLLLLAGLTMVSFNTGKVIASRLHPA